MLAQLWEGAVAVCKDRVLGFWVWVRVVAYSLLLSSFVAFLRPFRACRVWTLRFCASGACGAVASLSFSLGLTGCF